MKKRIVRNMLKTGWIGLVVVVCLLGAAACGKSGASDNSAASAGASSASPPASAAGASSSASADAATVNVEASDFEWKVSQTELKAGQPVIFKLSGKDGAHGFSIVGTDISEPVKTGDSLEVTWTPDKAGEYTIKCNRMCGSGHSSMETNITVK